MRGNFEMARAKDRQQMYVQPQARTQPVLAYGTSGCARSAQLQKRVTELERLLAERPQEAPAAPAAAACVGLSSARCRRSRR